jgi:hypothetical protein
LLNFESKIGLLNVKVIKGKGHLQSFFTGFLTLVSPVANDYWTVVNIKDGLDALLICIEVGCVSFFSPGIRINGIGHRWFSFPLLCGGHTPRANIPEKTENSRQASGVLFGIRKFRSFGCVHSTR